MEEAPFVNSGEFNTPPLPICTIMCKMLYDKLLTLENLPPPTAEKKLLSYGIPKENLNKIYLLPFSVTQEVKLAMFQHKIIHNILATDSILYKMKKVTSPSCLSAPRIVKTYVICLLAARKRLPFGISSKVGILP